MTKHSEKPIPAQSPSKTKNDDALSETALEKIAGGTRSNQVQSSLTKSNSDTANSIVGKMG